MAAQRKYPDDLRERAVKLLTVAVGSVWPFSGPGWD
jgi:hypothetical protein